jgi:hypothetical protein
MVSWTILMIGLGAANPKESPAELAAWIDAELEAVWRAKGLPVRDVAGDEVYLRRAYLELTGTIPSVAEARDFLDSTSASKREKLIQTLLDAKRFAEHYAGLWARTFAPAGNTRGPLELWLRGEFKKNIPFDQVARAMLTAAEDATTPGPAGFYFAVGNSPERVAEAAGRGLLGVRLGCARCHNHPLAAWTREDFWGLPAFFAGTDQDVRRQLLADLAGDFEKRYGGEAAKARAASYRKAQKMIDTEAKGAFRLDEEPARIRDAYGRTRFGQGCLLAAGWSSAACRLWRSTSTAGTRTATTSSRSRR